MAEKGPKNFSRFMRHGTRGDQVENGLKRQPGIKWQKKGRKIFRALCAIFLLLILVNECEWCNGIECDIVFFDWENRFKLKSIPFCIASKHYNCLIVFKRLMIMIKALLFLSNGKSYLRIWFSDYYYNGSEF